MAEHTTFRSFNAALTRYGGDEVPAVVRGRVTVIALEGAKVLTELTPVDRGRAKGNWQVTVGAPAEGEVDRLDPSPQGTASNELQRDTLTTLKDWAPGEWIWFHNGVPYITILNDGAANRTAHHMLERTVDHLRSWVGE